MEKVEDGGESNPIAIRVNRSVKMGVHFPVIFIFIFSDLFHYSSYFLLTIWIRLLNTEKDEI